MVPINNDLLYSSVQRLAHLIRTRQVSSEALTRAYLDRIATVNSHVNAVIQLADTETILARARAADAALATTTDGEETLSVWGPLHGVPFTIKDSFDTAGIITTYGTPGRATFVPDRNATVVQRLLDAGAICLGKTNTPELTLSFETDNPVHGRTLNPYNQDHMPGGSSGGAATAVALAMTPFDVGSDTGGSIRLPASFCGVCGIKPTTGNVPRTGHAPPPGGGPLDDLTQLGPITRYVEDLALLLPIIVGPDGRDPYVYPVPWRDFNNVNLSTLHVAVYTNDGSGYPTEPDVVAAIRHAATLLAKSGASVTVEETRPPGVEGARALLGEIMRGWDGGALVRMLLKRCGTSEAESSLQRYLNADSRTAAEIVDLLDRLDRFRTNMLTFLDDYDLILCPATPYPALRNGDLTNHYEGLGYTMTYNMTGWPAAVIRAGTSTTSSTTTSTISTPSLPIGLQIVAGPWREDRVLAAAAFLESALGPFSRPEL